MSKATIHIEWRFAEGTPSGCRPSLELVQIPVDVIVGLPQAALATKQVTSTMPVVLLSSSDRWVLGWWPASRTLRATYGVDPDLPGNERKRSSCSRRWSLESRRWRCSGIRQSREGPRDHRDASRGAGLAVRVQLLEVRTLAELEAVFAAAATERPDALLLQNSALTVLTEPGSPSGGTERPAHDVGFPEFAAAGGLMAYGPNRR